MPATSSRERCWKEITPEMQNIRCWLFLLTGRKDFSRCRCRFTKIRDNKERTFGNQSILSSSSAVNNYQISFPRKHKSAPATKVLGAPALSSHSNKWQHFSQANGPTCDHGQGGGHFKSIDEIDLLLAVGGSLLSDQVLSDVWMPTARLIGPHSAHKLILNG